jgi:hypothetical protein
MPVSLTTHAAAMAAAIHGRRARLTRYIFADNKLYVEAYPLLKLPVRQLSLYRPMGALELTVGNFEAKRPDGIIREHALNEAGTGLKPGSTGTPHQPYGPNGSPWINPTRWDMNAGVFIRRGPEPQRVLIIIRLADPLVRFMANVPAITAKDYASWAILSNPWTSTDRRTASFWCLYHGANGDKVTGAYNVALDVTDADDPAFTLPIIVDPKIPNRG